MIKSENEEICFPIQKSDVPTPPPGPGPGPAGTSKIIDSKDPNDKTGPAGFGPNHFIAAEGTVPYRIEFENEASATAPAQRVVVTDQLDANLDWDTFAWTDVGFGDVLLTVPAGSQHFQASVPMTQGGHTFQVEIELSLDSQTGLLTAIFESIDPATSLPPDVLTGFLPPEDSTGRGQGSLSYIVQPKTGLPTGASIRNVARIVFEANEPITTNQVDPHDASKGTDPAKEAHNTIDAGAPTSSFDPLPATTNTTAVELHWSGTDDAGGSGVAAFDIFVSDNDGPYDPLLTGTTAISMLFAGRFGHHYAFYSMATDHVGNRQPTPAAPQATTDLVVPPFFTVINTNDSGAGSLRQAMIDANSTPGLADTIVFTIPGPGPHAIQLVSPLPSLLDSATFEIEGDTVEIGTFSAFELAGFPSLTKTGAGTLVLGGAGRLSGQSLTVDEGVVQLAAGSGIVLVVDGVLVSSGAKLDLADNDLIVQATPATRNAVLANVTALIASGAAGLTWTGSGITSSAAANDPNTLSALGVMLNDDGLGGSYYFAFDGEPVDANSILVKYTYYGDADLSGSVDGTDYALTDNGFNSGLADWFNGDFDYSAAVDGTDYALIDNAFNSQTGPLSNDEPAGLGPIPRAASSPPVAGRDESSWLACSLSGDGTTADSFDSVSLDNDVLEALAVPSRRSRRR